MDAFPYALYVYFVKIFFVKIFFVCVYRWYRALNALRAMHTMRKFSLPDASSGYFNFNFKLKGTVSRFCTLNETAKIWATHVDMKIYIRML